jgi:F420-0:gamma-glutamyl ligase
MEVLGIQTRALYPPKDDLFSVFDEYLNDVRDGDIVVVSSKVMAIHQGRCLRADKTDKDVLVEKEAERIFSYYNSAVDRRFRLTIKGHTLVSAGGVDESNGNGYFVLWPDDIFGMCREIRQYYRKRFGVRDIAVIAVDSHSAPLRYGAVGIAIGFWGMHPLRNYIGEEDIFGRKFVVERANLVDSLAASAVLVMGEGAEQTPIAIIRDAKNIRFTNSDTRDELLIPFEEDVYAPMLKVLKKTADDK